MAARPQTRIVVETLRNDLENLNHVCNSLNERSAHVVDLGPSPADTYNAIKVLQQEARHNQKNQEAMLREAKDWVRKDAQELILAQLKEQMRTEIQKEVEMSVKSQVEAQILGHIHTPLRKQLEDCKAQLKEVKTSLENSEARCLNSTLELTNSTLDPLAVVLKSDGSKSKWYPADLTSLFAYDSDATAALLNDYDLPVDESLESNFNRFMAHIGIKDQLVTPVRP
ncbi:hypothetical protein WG66_001181 [Moniliophthora roreri]|nr:hypothetical protein WG66_001181 [Moniliophthora roreri]